MGFPDILHTYLVRLEQQTQLTTYTEFAITDAQAFLAELASVREAGYARSLEEYVLGVNAVAAPVFDAAGRANLAVGVLGLTSFLPAERLEEFGALVVAAARQMTAVIGGIWPH